MIIPLLLAAAQIDIYMGETIWADGSEPLRHIVYDIDVDGKNVGHLNSKRVLVISVPDGKHSITVWRKTIWGHQDPVKAEIEASGQNPNYFAINVYQRNNPQSGAGFFGLAGLAVQAAARSGHEYNPPRPSGTYVEEDANGETKIVGKTQVRIDLP
ncbi:MAG: hypothetical protein KGM93_18450 [Sphingomonadales bacterium]|nr:hypothetical protein [Sphingomonadales bacterium]